MVEIPRDKLVEIENALGYALQVGCSNVGIDGKERMFCDRTAVIHARELVADLLVPPSPKPDPQAIWNGLSQNEMHVIEHALGGETCHRNYYFTDAQDPVWAKLVEDRLATRGREMNHGECYFHVTDLGVSAFAKREVELRPLEIRELLRRFTPVMHECFRGKRCEDLQTMRGLIRRRLVQGVEFDEALCIFTFEYSPKGRALAKHLQGLGKKSPDKSAEAPP